MGQGKGLPGLRGTDHIGITVPDFGQAADFLENVLGFTPFYSHGPFKDEDGTWMADMLNVDPRAEIKKVQQFRCENGINIELFEYAAPDQRREMPKNSDWGGHHITLYVDDIDAAMEHLRSHGVRLMAGGGESVGDGPEAGVRSCYFLTPWDMQMELISFPGGKGYEKESDARLWDPRHPEK